jgi:ribosome-associated toxin RatA of RatAB toxin-antitoxin module
VKAEDLVMVPRSQHAAAAGDIARRLFVCAALAAMSATLSASSELPVTVIESDGVYRVTATFTVPQSPAMAIAVLTDFERIPQYVPDMKTSTIIERNEAGPVVEQEAVAKFMMFSKRVHLILQISEEAGTIRFRDRCGRSFAVYEGAWSVRPSAGGTAITYQLAAKPSFDVPAFLLKRLMRHDAVELIANITNEIAARAK